MIPWCRARGLESRAHSALRDAHRAASGPRRMECEGWGGLGLLSRPACLERQGAELLRPDPPGRRSGVVAYLHWMGFGLAREKAEGVLDRLAC